MIQLRSNQVEPIEKGNFFKDIIHVGQVSEMAQPIQVMPFGKYKGKKISNIPLDYRKWMIRAFEWNSRNVKLKKSIMATL